MRQQKKDKRPREKRKQRQAADKKRGRGVPHFPACFHEERGVLKAHAACLAEGVAVLEWEASFPLPRAKMEGGSTAAEAAVHMSTPEGAEEKGASGHTGAPFFPFAEKTGGGAREKRGAAKKKKVGGLTDAAAERITAFYAALARELCRLIEGELLPFAEGCYRKSDDPRKRFRFRRFRLLLSSRVTQEDERFFSVRRTLTLLRGGRTLFSCEEAEVFSMRSGLPLSAAALRAEGVREKEEPKPSARPAGKDGGQADAGDRTATPEDASPATRGRRPLLSLLRRCAGWRRPRRSDCYLLDGQLLFLPPDRGPGEKRPPHAV